MSIDYHTLLNDALVQHEIGWRMIGCDGDPDAAELLAARIPDLCPDCDEHGYVTEEYGHGAFDDVIARPCAHPNAPTIADLLRWGENVAKAQKINDPYEWRDVLVGRTTVRAASDLLAALRTEAD